MNEVKNGWALSAAEFRKFIVCLIGKDLMNQIKENLIAILIVGLLGGLLYHGSTKQFEELEKLPPELNSIRDACNLANYRACSEWDWFMIPEAFLPQLRSASGNRIYSTLILKEVCLHWDEVPSPTYERIIDPKLDTLYLCRMKDPKDINRGVILQEAELTPYHRKL